jgi:ribosome biogenesis protein Nip4
VFVENCKKCYSLGQNVNIDEKLEAFRGRCGSKEYIPAKPNKYGIKIYVLVDAKMLYTYWCYV